MRLLIILFLLLNLTVSKAADVLPTYVRSATAIDGGGQPIGIEGLIDIVSSPIYSTAVGLVLYGHYNRDVGTHFKPNGAGLFGYIGGRVSGWLGDLF